MAPLVVGELPEGHLARLQRGLNTTWRVEMIRSVPFSLGVMVQPQLQL